MTGGPFERKDEVDEPGIVGARWWQESLVRDVSRRKMLRGILIAAGGIAGFGMLLSMCAAVGVAGGALVSDDDTKTERRGSLAMQQEYGWSFGAAAETLTFDGVATQPYDSSALARMPTELAPGQGKLRPYWVPALFQSPAALPRSKPAGDDAPIAPLDKALRPIFTEAMQHAYRGGKSLGSLLAAFPTADKAMIVDLPGPVAVAFAAGLADVFDPVFLFDNWPHPRGVVKAHVTLAAAAYYQPLFVKTSEARRTPAPPAFVLDRARLAPYTDEATQFDNRHVAKLPDASQLLGLGIKRLLYVTTERDRELDDVNDDLVLAARSAIDVKLISASDFGPDPTVRPPAGSAREPVHYYASREATHLGFWQNYAWHKPPQAAREAPSLVSGLHLYVPALRATVFSGQQPPGFGTVPVVIALGTGVILGAAISRSGSWNRGSSSGG